MNYAQAIKELRQELEQEFEKAINEIYTQTEDLRKYVNEQSEYEFIISQDITLKRLRNAYQEAHLIANTKQEVLDDLERKIIKKEK